MNIDNFLNIGGLTLVALMILLFILDFVKYITDYKFTVELINSAIRNDDTLDAIYVYYDRIDFVSKIAKKIHYKKMQTIENMILIYNLTGGM